MINRIRMWYMEEKETTKKEELLKILDEMINTYENLPQHALITPVTHYDFTSLLLLVRELFRSA